MAITPASASASTARPIEVAPITTALVQGDETWLVVPMGHLSDLANTFWELFVRTPEDNGWVTVTPPGVADNGGLSITYGPAGSLLAGFLPSQDLTFSPLSITKDGGLAWAGVYFPEGLVGVPDALGGTAAGGTLGLGRSGALSKRGQLSTWRSVITAESSGARPRVPVVRSNASPPPQSPPTEIHWSARRVVGRRGWSLRGGTGRSEGHPIPATRRLTGATVSVLRLAPTATGVVILLRVRAKTGGLNSWPAGSRSRPSRRYRPRWRCHQGPRS